MEILEQISKLLKLKSAEGRQLWELRNDLTKADLISLGLISDNNNKPNSADKVYRKLATETYTDVPPSTTRTFTDEQVQKVYRANLQAIGFYQKLQAGDGHFPGDYGGPMFLTPGLIIAAYITEQQLTKINKELISTYFLNHQNTDGGWGLHVEGPSTMFGTVMQYVALRLLGLGAEHPALQKARNWILENGGAVNIPSWGKFYLAVLGVYEWDGCHSLFPEMWLFPKWLPFHPWRYWSHARMVYLPMAYCYGLKVKCRKTNLTEQLKKELYTQDYLNINWKDARSRCCLQDLYHSPSPVLKMLNFFTNSYERFLLKGLRKKAITDILDRIHAEDEHTNYINIGPVNQAMNSICVWHACGKDSPQLKKHVERWDDYLWLAEDGMKMNGYNGSQLWDTIFALQAIKEAGFEQEYPQMAEKAMHFVDISQIKEDVREHKKYFRHESLGGWPFSTREHGWPITDCTAEGLKVMLSTCHTEELPERLQQAAGLVLSFQNKDGGWASYEPTRAPKWVEKLNPSEIFGNIMLDYSYTECTSACIQSLAKLRQKYPGYHPARVERAIKRGAGFIKKQQLADGSWYGSWAVCFTYGTWFGVEGLLAAGEQGYGAGGQNPSPAIEKACQFLLNKQNPDGGWGESFNSCLKKEYVPHKESQVVNTAWALLTLMAANYPNRQAIDRGINYLLGMQQANGDFPQQSISGVFNHTCAITYTAYRNVFPIWALGRYIKWRG